MAIITGNISRSMADVNTASNALEVEFLDATTSSCYADIEVYRTQVDVVPSTLTDGTTYFVMHNLGFKNVLVRKIELMLAFAGTAASSVSSYRIERFTGSSFPGGTVLQPIRSKNSYSTSTIQIGTAPSGVTITNISFETGSVTRLMHLNQNALNAVVDLNFADDGDAGKLELFTREGLAIRANGAIVAGSRITGQITWEEYLP
jgi:hypothetical protein